MVPSRAGGRRCAFRDSPRKRPRRRSRAAALAPRAGRTRGRSASSPRPERHHRKPIRKMSFGRMPRTRAAFLLETGERVTAQRVDIRKPAPGKFVSPVEIRVTPDEARPDWAGVDTMVAQPSTTDMATRLSNIRFGETSGSLVHSLPAPMPRLQCSVVAGATSAVPLQRAGRAHGKPRYCGAAKDNGMSAAIYPE
ncbi:MAG: hypothetical protein JWM38_443 [Sphingomonas bacterium]|nr:hypothetical protein [Sphingomonas bacterium]